MSPRTARLLASVACSTALLTGGLTDAAVAAPAASHPAKAAHHRVSSHSKSRHRSSHPGKPAVHKSAAHKPAVHKPAAHKPAAHKPAVPKPPVTPLPPVTPPAPTNPPATPTPQPETTTPTQPAAPDPNLSAGGAVDLGNAEPAGPTDQLGSGPFDNARVAEIGLSKVGQNLYTPGSVDHGQCKQAVNDWVAAASNGGIRLGGSYYNDYVRVGAQSVGRDSAVEGDIIQLSVPGSPNTYKYGMHTAVVVGHASGSNTFDVVDSNSQNDDIVRHHSWNPYSQAASYGLQVNIWRTGQVTPVVTDPPPPVSTPTPTPTPTVFVHHVYGTCRDGACGLKVRTGPGFTSFAQVGVIPEGGEADVVCQARGERVGNSSASSGVWDRLTSGSWVADFYIDTPNIDQWSPPIPQC
ncbi:MAG TPA: hypothetical protein VIJ51_00440 [Solirubrobacteraceae bacterium]